MIITNKHNLPEPLVWAVRNDPYTRGNADFSATQIINSPYANRLLRDFDDVIEVDVVDCIWRLLGQAVHHILERAALESCPEYIVEKRFFHKVNGSVLSGQVDLMKVVEGEMVATIEDWKLTSSWGVKGGAPKEDWVKQFNILAFLARRNGYEVKKLSAVPIFRDWGWRMMYERNMPKVPAAVINVPIWPDGTAESYVNTRLRLQEQAMSAEKLEDIPPCTGEEMYEELTKYAVMTNGKKRAERVLNSYQEAENWMVENGRGTNIVCRPGERKKCARRYCDAHSVCPIWKAHKS